MRTRILLCTGIVLCLVGTLAADTTWIGPNGGLWSIPAYWAGQALPTPQEQVYFNGLSACILDIEGGEIYRIDNAGGPLKIVDGGSLTVLDWHILGYGEGDVGANAGRMEVYDGGVLNCMQRLYVGRHG